MIFVHCYQTLAVSWFYDNIHRFMHEKSKLWYFAGHLLRNKCQCKNKWIMSLCNDHHVSCVNNFLSLLEIQWLTAILTVIFLSPWFEILINISVLTGSVPYWTKCPHMWVFPSSHLIKCCQRPPCHIPWDNGKSRLRSQQDYM